MDQELQPQDGLIEVRLSDRTSVKVKELDGYEFMQAAEAAPSVKSMGFYQSLASVRALIRDGQSEPFGDASDINRLAKRLTGAELQMLLVRSTELFGADDIKEKIKNDLATP